MTDDIKNEPAARPHDLKDLLIARVASLPPSGEPPHIRLRTAAEQMTRELYRDDPLIGSDLREFVNWLAGALKPLHVGDPVKHAVAQTIAALDGMVDAADRLAAE